MLGTGTKTMIAKKHLTTLYALAIACALFLVLGAAIIGLNRSTPQPPNRQATGRAAYSEKTTIKAHEETVVVEPTDPVKSFEAVVEEITQRAEKPQRWLWRIGISDVTREHNTVGRWHKTETRYTDIRYDVKKSDSLVSPYKGMIEITWREFSYHRPREEDSVIYDERELAEATEQFAFTPIEYRGLYSWRDGVWVLERTFSGNRESEKPNYPFAAESYTERKLRLNELDPGELYKRW